MSFARFIYVLFNCSAQNPRRQAAAGLFFVRTVLVPSRRLARIRAEPETAGARLEGAPSCPPTTTDSRLRPEARWRLQRGMLGLRVRFRDNADRQRVASRLGRSVGRCRMRRNQVPPRQALACMGCFLETPFFGPTMDTSLFCLRAPLLGSLGAHICPCCECGEAKKKK